MPWGGDKKRKPQRKWIKCPKSWQEKFWDGKRWVHVTRYCTREQGHSGGCY